MGLFAKNHIQLVSGEGMSWQDAIKKSAEPLLRDGLIQEQYVDDVIKVCEEKGPYMNTDPDVILAHARPEAGTKEAVVSLMVTKHPIALLNDEKHAGRIWIFLAASNNRNHLSYLQTLASFTMNRERLEHMLNAKTVDELDEIANS